jgi:uncharacterized membrane protein
MSTIKFVAVALCILILLGQLWRAKKTDWHTAHWLYHVSAGLMSFGVACTMFVSVVWTDLVILASVFVYQCAGARRWTGDNIPSEFQTAPGALGEQ